MLRRSGDRGVPTPRCGLGLAAASPHPLPFPFVGSAAGGARRLPVPPSERATWAQHACAIERELQAPRDGSTEAALAHLTLLLVTIARISIDIGHDLRLRSGPLLASVLELLEEHYHDPASLATIATAVSRTPGHLTTVVRRRTGRSVQRWSPNGEWPGTRGPRVKLTSPSRRSRHVSATAS
jgi:hypothetical protein